MMMTILNEKILKYRLLRTRTKLDDAQHHLLKWRFSLSSSQVREENEKIAILRNKLKVLQRRYYDYGN